MIKSDRILQNDPEMLSDTCELEHEEKKKTERQRPPQKIS